MVTEKVDLEQLFAEAHLVVERDFVRLDGPRDRLQQYAGCSACDVGKQRALGKLWQQRCKSCPAPSYLRE